MSIPELSQTKLNIPVNGFFYLLLIVSFLAFLIVFYCLPTLVLQRFGPYYIGLQTDFSYQYYYTLLDALEESQQVIFALLFFILWVIFSIIIFTWLTVYLEKKIVWTRPEEFSGNKKDLKKLKKLIFPALLSLILLLYFALDTYLLIGNNGLMYNSFWSLKAKNYPWKDIKYVDSTYYSKDKVFHYYIVLNDGKKLLIDLEGAKFVSRKTNFPIKEK